MDYDHKIKKYFANASKNAEKNKNKYLPESKWAEKGTVIFKRKILGICGRQTVKTTDELEKILLSINENDLTENIGSLIKELVKKNFYYGSENFLTGTTYYLTFTPTTNKDGHDAYKIKKGKFTHPSSNLY